MQLHNLFSFHPYKHPTNSFSPSKRYQCSSPFDLFSSSVHKLHLQVKSKGWKTVWTNAIAFRHIPTDQEFIPEVCVFPCIVHGLTGRIDTTILACVTMVINNKPENMTFYIRIFLWLHVGRWILLFCFFRPIRVNPSLYLFW